MSPCGHCLRILPCQKRGLTWPSSTWRRWGRNGKQRGQLHAYFSNAGRFLSETSAFAGFTFQRKLNHLLEDLTSLWEGMLLSERGISAMHWTLGWARWEPLHRNDWQQKNWHWHQLMRSTWASRCRRRTSTSRRIHAASWNSRTYVPSLSFLPLCVQPPSFSGRGRSLPAFFSSGHLRERLNGWCPSPLHLAHSSGGLHLYPTFERLSKCIISWLQGQVVFGLYYRSLPFWGQEKWTRRPVHWSFVIQTSIENWRLQPPQDLLPPPWPLFRFHKCSVLFVLLYKVTGFIARLGAVQHALHTFPAEQPRERIEAWRALVKNVNVVLQKDQGVAIQAATGTGKGKVLLPILAETYGTILVIAPSRVAAKSVPAWAICWSSFCRRNQRGAVRCNCRSCRSSTVLWFTSSVKTA